MKRCRESVPQSSTTPCPWQADNQRDAQDDEEIGLTGEEFDLLLVVRLGVRTKGALDDDLGESPACGNEDKPGQGDSATTGSQHPYLAEA